MAQPPDDPDWSTWSHADAVALEDAVALSLDIGPGGPRHQLAKAGTSLHNLVEPDRDHYHERLTLSISHLGRDLPLAGQRLPPEMPVERNEIRLKEFAKFAEGMGWNLDDHFPWKTLTYTDDKGNEVVLVNVEGRQMVRTPVGGYITQEQWHAMTHPPHEPIPPEAIMANILQAKPEDIPVARLVLTSRSKPDWEYWGSLPEASIVNVVALSCNMDPSVVGPAELGKGQPSELYQFGKRLSIASANAVSGALRRIRINPGSRLFPDCIFDDVSLVEFFTWAKALPYPWELPDKFPRGQPDLKPQESKSQMQKSVPQEDSATGKRSIRTRERTTLLVIIAALAKKSGIDVGQTWKSAQAIEKLTIDVGARISPEAISKKLREIPDAIERAGKLDADED